MNFQKVEVLHNTEEQVREYVAAALVIADDTERAGEQWAAIFRAAYDGIAGKSVQLVEQPQIPLGAILNGRPN